MNCIKEVGQPEKEGNYLTAMQDGKRGFAVNYYKDGKWYSYPGGYRYPERYERKSVTHWEVLKI